MKTSRYLIALVVALGLIPILLDTSIVIVALTPIRNDLSTDTNTTQWIVTAFFLANAAVVAAVGGYLANRFGRQRLFLVGVTSFTMGSLLCGLSPSIGWLISFRVLQGIGAGVLLPIGPALAFDAFPKDERARASAVVGIPLVLAPDFGPLVGGYLTDTFDWHSIFFVNLPVGIIAVAVALVLLPRDQRLTTRSARFDYLGLALSTLGVVAFVYAFVYAFKLVTQTNPSTVTAANPGGDLYGWSSGLVWLLLSGGVVVLGLCACYALRITRDPALDLRQLGRREFLVSSPLVWATNSTSFSLIVLVPLYLESVRLPHLSALETGLALVPLGLGALAGTIGAATLYRALGPRGVVLIGAVLAVVSAWLLAQTIHPTADASQLLAAMQTQTAVPAVAGPEARRWGLLLVGLGVFFVSIPVQTLALEALTGAALAKASSLLLSTKLIFSSVGVAILTTLLIDHARSRATTLVQQVQALAPGAGTGAAADPRDPHVAAALRALDGQIAAQAGAWAIQSTFWLTCVGSLGLLALALLLPGRRSEHRQRPVAAPQPEPGEEQMAVGP